MNQSFNDEGLQFAWDSTSLQMAMGCLREYYFRMIEGWQPRGLNTHLRFGQHYATALEHYYKHLALGVDKEEALRLVVDEALRDTWDRTEADPVGAPWQSGDNNKSRETLIRTIIWYIDHFEDDPAPIVHLSDGKPAAELSFSLPVDNGLIFSGHLDRVVQYAGQTYVMDQKTTKGTIGFQYWDQWKPSVQMSMYTFAAQSIFAAPVKGVIIDAAQIAVGFTHFERSMTTRTPDELREWYDNTMFWIAQVHDAQRAGGNEELYHRFNPTACHKYSGCAFRTVCSRSPDVRQQFLLGDFERTSGWDPMARR